MCGQIPSATIEEWTLLPVAATDVTLLLQNVSTDSLCSQRGTTVPAASSASLSDGLFWSPNRSFGSSLTGLHLPPAMPLLQLADSLNWGLKGVAAVVCMPSCMHCCIVPSPLPFGLTLIV